MSGEKKLVGYDLLNFMMLAWDITEDEALNLLANEIGNVEL